MTRVSLFLLLAAAALSGAAPKFPAVYPPQNDVKIDHLVKVPMRDGVVLYADVYRPATDGKYPVLVSRTPYGTERFPSAYEEPLFFARRGYVFVYQDVRGRHESEGKWEPFRNDIEDGYDTVEWAAKQPWSNGKVGMQGHSYGGHVQWRAAMARPPHLVTIFPLVASTSLYHNWVTLNGAWRLSFNFGWGPVRQESRIMQNTGIHTAKDAPESQRYEKVLSTLPLTGMQQLLGRHAQFYTDWIQHPDYDDYWKKINAEEMLNDISIPVHTHGGWYDLFLQGTLNGYTGLSRQSGRGRQKSHLVVGPWEHGVSQKTGDLDFGPEARVEREVFELRWFDYWLKGIDNGLAAEAPVKIFVMGKNQWRLENEYPLARTQYRKMYLSSSGSANTAKGNRALSWEPPGDKSPPDRYNYDPANPVSSTGGNNCCGTPTLSGPRDQRLVESRDDVLVYSSPPLNDDLEVTGPVKVVLYASSDAPDTDFAAKLVDVYPDGRAINICEGILRARYRESTARPQLLEPGKVYALPIDLIGTSNVFLKGHRLRVDLTSSHFPQFDRNPNTGKPFGTGTEMRIARQTIYHTAGQPSHILLPVIP
jgi:putative CocE/NonD family hydrolase